MSKPVPKASAESVALYDALLVTNPEIKRKGVWISAGSPLMPGTVNRLPAGGVPEDDGPR